MKASPFVVDVRPVRSENITAEEYMRITKESPTLIERAQFVPPSQGKPGFGSFMVRYSRARHRMVMNGR